MFSIGSVITIKDENVKYVIVGYIDHNKGNYGACCHDETYTLVIYDKLLNYTSNDNIYAIDSLYKECGSREYKNMNISQAPFNIVEDLAPFEIKQVNAISIREKVQQIKKEWI